MKKIILLGLAIVLSLSACNQEKRYTQQSPEIDSYKKLMEAYKTQKWDEFPNHYADTAKIANNVVKKKGISVAEAIKKNQDDAALFNWVVENEEYEMVVTDKKETWVNFWGLWKGTLKSSGKVYEVPFHNTARFIDGKIVEEYGYWDNSAIMMDLINQPEVAVKPTDTISK
ncbi:nuclear transport factor 2 family protein [Flavobacterium buctense]|uniref:Nuclear transport factor 2 family protein n=1 Tax=Flavobacterium buctense TaxID=1648146 RepID=A0ABU9DZK4_9FLAO|nr:nuclear transport factor 2 family protein [Flavobacterium buctense]